MDTNTTPSIESLALARGRVRGVDPYGYATGSMGALLVSVEFHLRAGNPALALASIETARKGLTTDG